MHLKLPTKIAITTTLVILFFIGSLAYYVDLFLNENYFKQVKLHILEAQNRMSVDFANSYGELIKSLEFVQNNETLIASVELINNYQDIDNYNAVLLDEEKKEIARELLKKVKISFNNDIALYDKNEDLIAFVYKNAYGYRLNFVSYANAKKVVYSRYESEDEFSIEKNAELIYPFIMQKHVPYYTQPSLLNTIPLTYHYLDNKIFLRAHKSLFYKDGKTIFHIEMSKSFGSEYFATVAHDLDIVIKVTQEKKYMKNSLPLLKTVHLLDNNIEQTKQNYSVAFSLNTRQKELFIITSMDKFALNSALNENREELVLFLLMITILMFAIFITLLKRGLSNPLNSLMYQISKIRNGDYSQSTVIKTSDELEEISKHINMLASAVSSRETKLIQSHEQQKYLSNHDELTSLYNRRYFDIRLEQALEVAKRKKTKIALLFLDLDQFKEVNDTLGHHIGDMLIQGVAQRLTESIRKSDVLARIGGDEFEIFVEAFESENEIATFANKILEIVKEPFVFDEYEISTTVSIGISLYPNDCTTMEELVKNADLAMYKSKNIGRNNFNFYSDELSQNIEKRKKIIDALKIALKNKEEFLVYYQPKISIKTQKVVGAEALVRWKSAALGFVRPDEFISIAEDTHMIIEIGKIVLSRACEDFVRLKKEGISPKNISVNVSSIQLEHSDFLQTVKDVIQSSTIRADELELEVTESYIATNEISAIATLSQFREMNIGLAIDDFGTGYSSLSYLKKLPITRLKIDKSFVDDLPDSQDSIAVVNTIISLAEAFKLDITVEGVETKEQLGFFRDKYCNDIQGYIYSKPLPFEEFREFVAKNLKQ